MTRTASAMPVAALTAVLLASVPASAAVTITQQSGPAPAYDTLLTFDEPGTPTGLVAADYWQASHGVTVTDGVNGAAPIADFSATSPWLSTGNMIEGVFGVFMTFDQEVNAMSFQAWDTSGAPNPFGNGLVIILSDINDNVIASQQFTGAWGGVGDTWFDITTTAGETFQKIVVTNFSFFPVSYMDNISWTTVPAPGCAALIGFAAMIGRRRHRC